MVYSSAFASRFILQNPLFLLRNVPKAFKASEGQMCGYGSSRHAYVLPLYLFSDVVGFSAAIHNIYP